MRLRLGQVVFCVLCSLASAAWADIQVTYVGDNPWSNSGFPSTGGTGMIASQQAGVATLEKTFTSLGDVPIIVHQGPTPASGMETIHIDERVRNNTGVNWTDFHLDVQLIDASPNLVVDFLNVSNPTGEFNNIMTMPNALWLIGPVPNGSEFSLSFDLKLTAPEGGFNLFGIHETPSIPEPSTLVLANCALLGLSHIVRRRIRLIVS